MHAEGALTYDALLFVPSRAPYDLYSKDYKKGLALYSSNVLIMEKCEELLPDYLQLRARRGGLAGPHAEHLARDAAAQQPADAPSRSRIEKKVTADLADMRDNDREAYEEFFDNFGRGLKYGIYTSYGMNKDTLGRPAAVLFGQGSRR